MGRADRAEPDSVIGDLVAHGHRFEFFQAVTLLRQAIEADRDGPVSETAPADRLRFRATPTLGFPASDITGVSRHVDAQGRPAFEVEVPFLGLYGPSSPLPVFITEHVIARDRDSSTLRDFLDVFNHRTVELLYAIWRKYRHSVTYRAGAADPISRYVIALTGLLSLRSTDSPLSLESLLPFAGPLSLAGHSALLLETLVSHQFDGVGARVEEFVLRNAIVDDAQKCRLGARNATLGDDWVLGDRVPDATGKFRLWLGPLGIDDYRGYLPGQPSRRRLTDLVGATIRTPLEYDLVLVLHDEEIPAWRLGAPAALGHDAWLLGTDGNEAAIISVA